MSEFTPIETQEDFDKAIKSRLAQKDRVLAEKYKSYLSPEDACFVIGHKFAGYEKYLLDHNDKGFRIYAVVPALITKKEADWFGERNAAL